VLLHRQFDNLKNWIGKEHLAGYVKTMELTLLLEAWLSKDEYSKDDLQLFDRFIPYFIHTFTSTMNRTAGNGMKLNKIHLLHLLKHQLSDI